VLLDVVYNHLGPLGNVLGRFGPYFTERYATPWGAAPNLDGPESDEVRRFFLDNALTWLRAYRFDGLRVDAVHAIIDTRATPLLEELATEVHALAERLGRPLVVIPESDRNDPRLVVPREAGGAGCDAQWNDDFHHALHVWLTGERAGYYADFEPLSDLARALERVFVYEGRYSAARRQRHGRPAGALPGRAVVVYAQTHDQVGNRARGERLAHLVSDARLRIASALVFTSAPMICAAVRLPRKCAAYSDARLIGMPLRFR
jgi:maltooligosyltrehalose trehalohydrolase